MKQAKMVYLLFIVLPAFIVGGLPSLYAFSIPKLPGAGNGDNGEGGVRKVRMLNYSKAIKECESLFSEATEGNWNDLLQGSDNFALQIKSRGLKSLQQEIFKQSYKGVAIPLTKEENLEDKVRTKISKGLGDTATFIVLCEAYRAATLKENYDPEEAKEFKGGGASASVGVNAISCMNQSNQQQQQQCLAQSQGQNPMSCKNEGQETHDYLACKKIIKFVEGFALGSMAMQMQQSTRAGISQIDAQQDLIRKQASGEGIGLTDGLQVQQDSFQQQGNMAYEMAAYNAAKAGTLLAMINAFPDENEMKSRCVQNFSSDIVNSTADFLGGEDNDFSLGGNTYFVGKEEIITYIKENLGGEVSASALCDMIVDSSRDLPNQFFLNHEIIDQVKAEAYKAGLEAVAQGVKGHLLHKQADMVGDAIRDVNEFEPPEFPVAVAPEATVSECLVNPDADGCINGLGAYGASGFGDTGVAVNLGGSVNLGNPNTLSDVAGGNSATGTGNTAREIIPNEFGIVSQDAVHDNSFQDGVAAAGSIKPGQGSPGGAGAGGGGSGGGAGGTADGKAQRPDKAKTTPSRNIKIATNGSGLGIVGGRGSIGGSQRKSENPFSKLLGKDKGGKNRNLSFRGPAQIGEGKGTIFDQISKAYSAAVTQGKVLKYNVRPQK